jgi:hypothetical protein
VLIFGPSTLSSDDLGSDKSLLALTRVALAHDRPEVSWTCDGVVSYLAPGVARRVLSRVESDPPDVVVLRFPQSQFMSDYVVYRIREYSRLAYRVTVTISGWINRLAGGGPLGRESVRGWVFRVPRWLVERVVGVAPSIRVEDAIDAAIETLDGLIRREDLRIVYIMSGNTIRPNIPLAQAAKRRQFYIDRVRAHCQSHRIPFLDPNEIQEQLGLERTTSADGWHTDLRNRDLDARVLSQAILQSLDGATELDFSAITGGPKIV